MSPQTHANRCEPPDHPWWHTRTGTRSFAGNLSPDLSPTFCFPCRRSWVFDSHQPLSEDLCFAGIFRCGSRLVLLHQVGLTPDSRSADRRRLQGKCPVCRPILVRPNRSHSAGLQKVECSACCGRWPTVPANRTFLRTDACPRATSDPDPRGRVRFQSRYREVDLGPHSDPGEHGSHAASSPQIGVRGSGAVPVTGGMGRGNRSGSIAEAVAYIGSGRLLATGLSSRSWSLAGVSWGPRRRPHSGESRKRGVCRTRHLAPSSRTSVVASARERARPARPSSARPNRRLQEAQHLGCEQIGGGVHCSVSLPRHDREAAVRQSPPQRLAGRLERFAAVAALEI